MIGARSLKALLAALGLLGGLLVLLPVLFEVVLERWLVQRGAQHAEVEDVDFNVLLGTASVEGLEVRLDDRMVLGESDVDVELSWRALFRREVAVESAVLEGLSMEVEVRDDGQLRIGSFLVGSDDAAVHLDSAAAQEPWWIRVEDLSIQDGRIRFIGSGLDMVFDIDVARVRNFFTGPSDEPGSVKVRGRLNGAPMTLEARIDEVWPRSEVAGTMSLGDLDIATVSTPFRRVASVLSGSMSASGDFSVRRADDGALRINYSGSARLMGGRVESELLQGDGDRIDWRGDLSFASSPGDAGPLFGLEGRLQGNRLLVNLSYNSIRLEQDEWALEGDLHLGRENGRVTGIGSLGGSSTRFKVIDPARDIDLVSANTLAAGRIELDREGHVAVDTLELSAVQIGDPDTGDSGPAFDEVRFEGVMLEGLTLKQLDTTVVKGLRMSAADRRLVETVVQRIGLSLQ